MKQPWSTRPAAHRPGRHKLTEPMSLPSRPARILQVVHSLAIGGTERVVSDLVEEFNDLEFHTSVCCLDGLGRFGEDLVKAGVRVHVLDRRPGVDLSLASQLRRLYRTEEIDVIHAHQYTPYFYAATAALLAGCIPVIFTEHGRHWPDGLRIKRAVVNQVLRLTTQAYTAVSEFSRQSLVQYEKIPTDRIRVIYNGIGVREAQTSAFKRKSLREKMRLSEEDLLVLSIGRMDPIKDFKTLIQAFFYAAQRLPRTSLWIVGDGDHEYRKQLECLVEQLRLSEKVKFLGARQDVTEILQACDLFVLPSVTEAASMTILEAMEAGRAVVATCTGGNPELVSHDITGWLVPVGDVSAMAEAVTLLLSDPIKRQDMGRAGRARIRERFTKQIAFAQYRNLYRSVRTKASRGLQWAVASRSKLST